MTDFTLFVPLEIFRIILSHLNQVDSIECMNVCRRWYKLIPQYGKEVWKELEISEKSWPRFNNALAECLGTHVEKVSIVTDQNLDKILQQLERRELSIRSLEIKAMLEDYTFGLDRTIVFDGIGLFGKTLKELFIDGPCTYYFSLATLLGLLPALTHLQIKLSNLCNIVPFEEDESINGEVQPNIQSDNDDNDDSEMYNLVFLSLFSETYINTGIKQIVKRCPRLKYLLASNTVIKEHYELPPVDLANILELCPSIRNVHWGDYTVTKKIEKEWLILSRREREYTDNENTSDYEKREANYLRQVIFTDFNEQGHISTLTKCSQQPSLLEHLHLCGEFNVDLYQLWNSFAQHNSNLISRPTRLKSLELVEFRVPRQTETGISFHNLFGHFQHVERLYLFLTSTDTAKHNVNVIREMVRAISHQLPQLKHFHLRFRHYNVPVSSTPFNKLFTPLCDGNQKLEILHLSNVPVTSLMLLGLCYFPKLHTLRLSGSMRHKKLTKDDWISFAGKLQEQEQNNDSVIRSIFLSRDYCNGITDEVLQQLAGVKSLKTLQIEFNDNITDAGINKFASIKNSISKTYTKIELYGCKKVSSNNPYVLFVSSPFYRHI